MSLIASGRAEASPIGEATQFEEAIAEFAMAYTDQTERDRRAFVDAIKADRISASTPGLFLGGVIGASGPGRACVRSAAANDRAFVSEADGALPGRPDGGAVDLDGTLTPAPDAMAEAFRRAGLTGKTPGRQ
jgi:hypothetical protein